MRADNTIVSENWILIDHETGLHVGWYFWLRVLDEVNRSGRYGSPFGLLLLEPEQRAAPRKVIDEASSKVANAVRSTDLAGRLGAGRVGVILFEQDEAGAETAAQRILERLAARSSATVSWQHSLYCYPRDAFAISNLLTQGRAEGERRREPA
jgi:PleD family two-component response regulator